MVKIDLHIHTRNALYESEFLFSIEKLKDYVSNNNIKCIAITNHNLFDKIQYIEIKEALDITVLPGVEVDVNGGHLLVIGEFSNVDDFSTRCQIVNARISDENDFIDVLEFKAIFDNYDDLLLIPHYRKDKSISLSTIREISTNISCGEVSSANKWVVEHNKDILVPVLFSDSRMSDTFKGSFKQTFIDVDTLSCSTLKIALSDKSRVWLNDSKVNDVFEIDNAGISVSSRLNVIMGKRSSGKTYFLNKINDLSGRSVKYIRQFELTESSKIDLFEKKIQGEFSDTTNQYLDEFRSIVSKVIAIDVDMDMETIDEYITTLKDKASTDYKQDIYSKSAIYDESTFSCFEEDELSNIVKYLDYLLESKFYKDELHKIINESVLIEAVIKTVKEYKTNKIHNVVIRITNEFITTTKRELKSLSRIPQIPSINTIELAKNIYTVDLFNCKAEKLKEYKKISEIPLSKFRLVTYSKSFSNVSQAREFSKITEGCNEIFREYYDKPYEYLRKLSESLSSNDSIYKMVFGVYHEVINEYGVKLSGGQRSEYSLVKKLDDCKKYDVVLIDEPEGSFDNIFLKDEIIKKVHEIANNSTIFIATHNNTIGVSLKPNYIIYTNVTKTDKMNFNIFSGKFGEKYLIDSNGDTVLEYDVLLDSMESGEDIYDERKIKYETIKNC